MPDQPTQPDQPNYHVHIDSNGGPIDLVPTNIVGVRERRRAQIQHTNACIDRLRGKHRRAVMTGGYDGQLVDPQCQTLGCVTPLPSTTELLLVSTIGPNSSIMTEMPKAAVLALVNSKLEALFRLRGTAQHVEDLSDATD